MRTQRPPKTRAYRGGTIIRLAHGQYQVCIDGVDLGIYATPACAEWVINDHLFYLLDTNAVDPTSLNILAIAEDLIQAGPCQTAPARLMQAAG